MRVCSGIDLFPPTNAPVILSAGNFDGLHLGHRTVLKRAGEVASARNGETWILTFDPHPLRVLRPDKAPPSIFTAEQTHARLASLGIDGCIRQPFSREIAEWSATEFFERVCRAIPGLSGLVVGDDWRFGRGAEGDKDLLSQLGADAGIIVEHVPQFLVDNLRISSTGIRELLAAGLLEKANHLLGAPYAIRGIVEKGRQEGRTLGYPTANIKPHNDRLLPDGIYAAAAWLDGRVHHAAAYIPPLPHEHPGLVEAHLLDFSGDVYGQEIELFLMKRMRPHEHIDSLELLKKQIGNDVAGITEWWKQNADQLQACRP